MLKRFVHYLNNQKNFILLIGCISLFSSNIFSRENNDSLYLIAGTIYVNIPPGAYYSYLFRYDNHALDTVAVLSTDSTQLKFIKAYHNQRKVVILKDGYIYNNNHILQVIPMDNPVGNIKTLNMGDGNNLFEKNLAPYNDSLYYIFDDGGPYIGVNINSLNNRTFNSPEILKNVIIKGAVGGAMEFGTRDCMTLDQDKNSDSIIIPTGGKKVYINFIIPKAFSSGDGYYSLLTNNKNYSVLWNNNSEPNQTKTLGWSDVIILDKVTQQWRNLRLKGSNVNLINFNNWLAGWVTEEYDNKNGYAWVSPGEKDRKQEDNALGSTFDERALDLEVYMPGILYLYNMDTKQYFEWNTGQGDSEILLVQGGMVYYRVSDKIYKAPIVNGKSIGTPELIIQDERVNDIHWAFISGN